jgi:hypothetical protein
MPRTPYEDISGFGEERAKDHTEPRLIVTVVIGFVCGIVGGVFGYHVFGWVGVVPSGLITVFIGLSLTAILGWLMDYTPLKLRKAAGKIFENTFLIVFGGGLVIFFSIFICNILLILLGLK